MTAADSPPADPQANRAYRKAQDQIAEAARAGSTHLDLSGMELTSVPPEVGQLAKLTNLRLYHNQLTSVPPEIGQLANLFHL